LNINNCRAVCHNAKKPIAKPSAIAASPWLNRTLPINVEQPIAKSSIAQKIAYKQSPRRPSQRQEAHRQAVSNHCISITEPYVAHQRRAAHQRVIYYQSHFEIKHRPQRSLTD
jgi:hypothetical protein